MLRKLRISSTDPAWIDVLRRHNVRDNVNFWRKDRRKVKLPGGSLFFFWARGSRSIAGGAIYREQVSMSIREAWNKFGVGNGATSFERLRERVVDVLHLPDDALNCLVLDAVKFFAPEECPPLPRGFDANKNPKDYYEGKLPQIEEAFKRLK